MYNDSKIAGLLLTIGSVLCVFGIIAAEALYPNYSTSENYISDLGVGPSALIFNSSVFLLGVLAVSGVYFIQKAFSFRLFSILAAIAGIGAMGVGLFPEDAGLIHAVFSLIAFLFAGISAIASYRLEKPPISYVSIMLGAMSLVALVLFASDIHLGLGKGGMERMIAYPALLWMVCFGGHLMSDNRNARASEK
ncbi:MAG: DUF998 domain-containing protein [Candidatus Bathyarchaeota archaeon]|nr:MAG: DUF998 domain-containing protein [Candidatus Bathyarchaeota archaeon]